MRFPWLLRVVGFNGRVATGRAKIIRIGREVQGLRKDGTTFPLHLSVGQIMVGSERKFTGILHDLVALRASAQAETRADRSRAAGDDDCQPVDQDPAWHDVDVDIDGTAPPVSADADMLRIVFQNQIRYVDGGDVADDVLR
jgi:hypothetical protein